METNEEFKKKKKLSIKKAAAIFLSLAAAVLVITEATGTTQALAGLLNPAMHFVQGAYITHEAGSALEIHAADGGFFLVTRDSMRFHNAEGAEIFRHAHLMSNPRMFARGNYAAILEQGGRTAYVYNSEGLLYPIVTDAPIHRFSLGVQGFAAIIMYTGGMFGIEIYNNFGAIFYHGSHVDENIVPMLTEISHDGRVLAISYLDINDAQMNSFVSFISIDDAHVGADDIFAKNTQNPGQIIGGAMRFMVCGRLIAISDTRIFAMEQGATVWEIPLNNRISHVAFADNWFAVAYGAPILNRAGHAAGTVAAYNALGEQLFAYNAHGGADSLKISGSNVVVGAGGQFTALTNAGQALWQLDLPNNVTQLGMMGASNNVVAFSPTQTDIWRRVRVNP